MQQARNLIGLLCAQKWKMAHLSIRMKIKRLLSCCSCVYCDRGSYCSEEGEPAVVGVTAGVIVSDFKIG